MSIFGHLVRLLGQGGRNHASRAPSMPELDSLLALMLLHDARRASRADAAGDLVLLADQDRMCWDRAEIVEGRALVQAALRRAPAGPYALEAAIAVVHAEAACAEETDWPQIAGLYEKLRRASVAGGRSEPRGGGGDGKRSRCGIASRGRVGGNSGELPFVARDTC